VTIIGALPKQFLANTGDKAAAVFAVLADSGCELFLGVGCEGKHPLPFDGQRPPHTAAMPANLQIE